MDFANFDERVATYFDQMSPAEQRVARVFQEHKEEVLFASAASLAAKAETSDATVVRTTKALGFKGMNDLRRSLAAEVKQTLSLSSRLTETLSKVGDDLQAAFDLTIDIHLDSIGNVRRNITPQLFQAAIQLLEKGRRVVIFGIGPSSAIAVYLATQLGRFGLDVQTLTRTGLLFADDVRKLRPGDVVLAMAYTHIYRELAVLLAEADRRGIPIILLTDSLGGKLRDRVDVVLQVERGRAELLSMHTATLGLLEAMLVGIAVKRPGETIQNLDDLNRLREEIVGESIDAPTRVR